LEFPIPEQPTEFQPSKDLKKIKMTSI